MSQDPPEYTQVLPPGYQQGPPPKEKHTLRNIFLVLIGLFILFLAGCMALLGGAVKEVDKAVTEEEANDKPIGVKEGSAFTHDDYEVSAGWRIVHERFVRTADIRRLKVTNVSDDARAAQLTFRFYKGNENLAEVLCTANEMQSGERSRMQCFSLADRFPKGYDTIRVSDTW